MSLIQTQAQANKPSSGSLPFLINELGKSGDVVDRKFDTMINDEMDRGDLEIKFNAKRSEEKSVSESAPVKKENSSIKKSDENLNKADADNTGEEKNESQSPVSASAQEESSESSSADEVKVSDTGKAEVKENASAEDDSNAEEMTDDSLYLYMAMQADQAVKLEPVQEMKTAILESDSENPDVSVEAEPMTEDTSAGSMSQLNMAAGLLQGEMNLAAGEEMKVEEESLPQETAVDDSVTNIGSIQTIMAVSEADELDAGAVDDELDSEIAPDKLLSEPVNTAEVKKPDVLKDNPVSVSAFSNGSEINFNLKINLEAILPRNTQRNMEGLLEANFKVPVNEMKAIDGATPNMGGFKSLSALNTSRPTVPVIKLMTVNPDSLQAQIRETLSSELKLQGKDKVEIRLDPPEWGKIHVKIESREAGLKVSFFSDNPLVRESLERHMADLKAMLNQDGFNLSNLNVGVQDNAPRNWQGDEKQERNQADFEDATFENEKSGPIARQRMESTSVIDHVV